MTKDDVLTVKQIAGILQISTNTIQRRSWRERTGCPIRKKGRKLYALVQEFHKWLKS